MGTYAKILKAEAGRLVRDEGGVALMLTLGVFLFLFLACCGVYAVGETISRRVDLQNASDAGAHAAAVAQADALSRMAVVNRAMSWNYVQMTKMQMDYITYNWLKVTCDKFAEDKQKCLKHDSPWDIMHPSRNSGWTFVPDLLGGVCQKPATTFLFTSWWTDWWGDPIWPKSWLVLDCQHNTHNNGNNRISNYIGMRSGNDTKAEEIFINGFNEDRCLHFRQSSSRRGAPYGGDLDYVVEGEVQQSAILSQVENAYGGYGCPDLSDQIDSLKTQVALCNFYLSDINGHLTNDITRAAMEAVRQSLPRTGESDRDIIEDDLEDYYCLVFGGTSPGPREYAEGDAAVAGNDGSRRYRSFFSGLRNTEQDEMVFLNMADGLPTQGHATLADYFADGALDDVGVPGLDQWFVRCYPEESQYNGTNAPPTGKADGCGGNVCLLRDWGSKGGIVRCYKNANYHELRSQSLPQDIHRGNYCFDGVGNAVKYVSTALGSSIGQMLNSFPLIGQFFGSIVTDLTSGMIENILNGIAGGLFGNSIVEPSCINRRETFPDTCANIPGSVGLVAEYEWAAAYWVCWYEEKGWWPWGSVRQCWHLPLPIGAAYGGATDNGYNPGSLLGFLDDLFRNFFKSPKGHSRMDYRTECISIDGERWDVAGCGQEALLNGHGANTGLKSYVRVYGDDKDAFDKNYYGTPAMPWLLNEDFFNGGGTIVVGVARKNRNAFEALLGAIEEKTNIFSLFTPWEGSHLVALSASRAAYAPRTGELSAEGADTVNSGDRIPRYDLHYDATAKNLDPHLPSGSLFTSAWNKWGDQEDQKGQRQKLQSAPYFFGCVCVDDNGHGKMAETYGRLRRQWNLCQTDWDGVLLPLRYARCAIADWSSFKDNETTSARDDKPPEWGPGMAGVMELSTILMNVDESNADNSMLWQRLDGDGTTTLKKLLDQGDARGNLRVDGDVAFADLIWGRRIL